jgi:hypothetical protein
MPRRIEGSLHNIPEANFHLLFQAKQVLRAAGLARLKMNEAVPSSYKRWLKPRVAKYMDDKDEKEERFVQLQAMETLQKSRSVSSLGGALLSGNRVEGSDQDQDSGDWKGGTGKASEMGGGDTKDGRKGLPKSYRRWYNKRVDQFLRSEKEKK